MQTSDARTFVRSSMFGSMCAFPPFSLPKTHLSPRSTTLVPPQYRTYPQRICLSLPFTPPSRRPSPARLRPRLQRASPSLRTWFPPVPPLHPNPKNLLAHLVNSLFPFRLRKLTPPNLHHLKRPLRFYTRPLLAPSVSILSRGSSHHRLLPVGVWKANPMHFRQPPSTSVVPMPRLPQRRPAPLAAKRCMIVSASNH